MHAWHHTYIFSGALNQVCGTGPCPRQVLRTDLHSATAPLTPPSAAPSVKHHAAPVRSSGKQGKLAYLVEYAFPHCFFSFCHHQPSSQHAHCSEMPVVLAWMESNEVQLSSVHTDTFSL